LDAPAGSGGAPRLALQSGRYARPRPRGWLPAALAAARRAGPGAGRAAALMAAAALLLGAAAAVSARARTDAHAAALHEARGGCAWHALTKARPSRTHAHLQDVPAGLPPELSAALRWCWGAGALHACGGHIGGGSGLRLPRGAG